MNNELWLNKAIYHEDCIIDAISEYTGIAQVKVEESAMYYRCFFDECIYEVETTKMEFENYLVGLEKVRR